MQAAYSLNSNELNINFLNSIKEMFQNKDIEIIVKDCIDSEVDKYRKSISNRLEQYKSHPESFTELTDEFWVDTEKRLIERHQKRAV